MTFSTSQWPNEIIIFVIYVEQYQEQSQFSKGLGCLQYCFCAHMVFSALLRCCDPKPSGCSDSQYHPLSPNITPFLRLLLFSHSFVSHSLWPHGLQHTRFPCLSPSPGAWLMMPIESVMPSNHLNLCHPFLLLPSVFPSIRVFSSESVLRIRWPKYWSFSFSICPSNEYSGLISFRIGWAGWISFQSKGLWRVLSNITVQKHQFFGTQPSLLANSHIHTWLLEKS